MKQLTRKQELPLKYFYEYNIDYHQVHFMHILKVMIALIETPVLNI